MVRFAVVLPSLGCLAVLLLGCAGAEGEGEHVEAALEVGTGSWRFEEVLDGDRIELVRGAQGGWHLWISLRVRGAEMQQTTGTIRVLSADGDLSAGGESGSEGYDDVIAEATIPVMFDPPKGDGSRSYVGWPHVIPDPGCAVGRLVRVEAVVVGPGGDLRDERDIEVGPGADPPDPCDP
ncbi:MAG: hypothetical protein KC416_08760 [Myxococcales bacterium]|nr:hypothetical protein [Myxococcales bacterium]